MSEIFADVLMDVQVTGPVVRLDFGSLSATEKTPDGQPALVFRQRVVMPLDGFLRSFATQEEIMARMIDAGVITASARTPMQAQSVSSPNFPDR